VIANAQLQPLTGQPNLADSSDSTASSSIDSALEKPMEKEDIPSLVDTAVTVVGESISLSTPVGANTITAGTNKRGSRKQQK